MRSPRISKILPTTNGLYFLDPCLIENNFKSLGFERRGVEDLQFVERESLRGGVMEIERERERERERR